MLALSTLTLSLPTVGLGATLTTLYSFEGKASDEGYPDTGVAIDAAGNLFGTTRGIGPSSGGTIYEISSGNNLFSTIYRFSAASGSAAGSSPGPLMVGSNGNLFGTTIRGGAKGRGTVFEFESATHNLTTRYSFAGADGNMPYGLTEDATGNLYGTTYEGGTNGYGTVYEIAAGTYSFTSLHSFTYVDGAYPQYRLSVNSNGDLSGTTGAGGGVIGGGTAFELTANTQNQSDLYTFPSISGNRPNGGLAMDGDGNLYGTTIYVGNGASTNTAGTVYKIEAGTHSFTILHSFSITDGNVPTGGLIIDSAGNLYGTTAAGGIADKGTIFKIAAGTHTFSTLHSFTGADGSYPTGGLTMDSNGNLYGTSVYGGMNGYGTVFKLSQAIPEASSLILAAASLMLFAIAYIKRLKGSTKLPL